MTLKIHNLSYHFNKRPLIRKISLTFEPGILYGILGPNGSGKTTLLKTIAGIWPPSSGQLSWQGEDLLQFSRLKLSQTISLVPQNPTIHFDFDVETMVSMGRYPYGCRTGESQKKVKETLQLVNATHLYQNLISNLSGGERQRIYIARALATEAPVLLLDEPTSHLDLRHQIEIWILLRRLVQNGKIVIVAMHDLLAAQRYCDHVVILNGGQCYAKGSYTEVITPSLLQSVFGVDFDHQFRAFEIKD